MGWKTMAAAVVLSSAATTVSVSPAVAEEAPQWQVTLLPMPADSPNADVWLYGSDGHGGYAGTITNAAGWAVATWRDGEVVVHDGPNGHDFPEVRGESWDGTVLVDSVTLDPAGVYHPVSLGSFGAAAPLVIGPRGDLVGLGTDPESSERVALYWPSPSAEPVVLAGMLPNSYPAAIDDDGTVVFRHPDGPYLLRDGDVQRLTLPEGYILGTAYAIRHGVVTGSARPPEGSDSGAELVWRSPDCPQVLVNSIYGPLARNSHGLSVATVLHPGFFYGAGAAWWHGRQLGLLPALDGLPAVHPLFVDDDGTIAGVASGPGMSDHGRPALWRLVRD
jgi:hypothetical protein